MTHAELVALYVKTCNDPENGWGQNIVDSPGHPCHGAQSHYLLRSLYAEIGETTACLMITEEFKRVSTST